MHRRCWVNTDGETNTLSFSSDLQKNPPVECSYLNGKDSGVATDVGILKLCPLLPNPTLERAIQHERKF